MRIVAKLLLVVAIPALLGCSAADPPARSRPSLEQQIRAQMAARAALNDYRRSYAQRLQAFRMQRWEAIRHRAQRQIAAQDAVREQRLEAARRRWLSFQ